MVTYSLQTDPRSCCTVRRPCPRRCGQPSRCRRPTSTCPTGECRSKRRFRSLSSDLLAKPRAFLHLPHLYSPVGQMALLLLTRNSFQTEISQFAWRMVGRIDQRENIRRDPGLRRQNRITTKSGGSALCGSEHKCENRRVHLGIADVNKNFVVGGNHWTCIAVPWHRHPNLPKRWYD